MAPRTTSASAAAAAQAAAAAFASDSAASDQPEEASATAYSNPNIEWLPKTSTTPEPLPVERLNLAQALPEYTGGAELPIISDGIQSFKDEDHRTMVVRVLDGTLVKQLSTT